MDRERNFSTSNIHWHVGVSVLVVIFAIPTSELTLQKDAIKEGFSYSTSFFPSMSPNSMDFSGSGNRW